jgi:integrase
MQIFPRLIGVMGLPQLKCFCNLFAYDRPLGRPVVVDHCYVGSNFELALRHSSRQIVLRRHKRAKTVKNAAARRITVNDELAAILDRWCNGKQPHEPIFTDPKGRPWTRLTLGARFKQVRELAGVRNEAIIYSFRHLWISDVSGLDVATVSKMAGTSIAMIEKVTVTSGATTYVRHRL